MTGLSWGEVAAGFGALLSFVFAMVKVSVTKTLSKIDQLNEGQHAIKNAITALEIKVVELQGIREDVKDVIKNNFEVMTRVSDLKKDVDAAHASIRELKRELQ